MILSILSPGQKYLYNMEIYPPLANRLGYDFSPSDASRDAGRTRAITKILGYARAHAAPPGQVRTPELGYLFTPLYNFICDRYRLLVYIDYLE